MADDDTGDWLSAAVEEAQAAQPPPPAEGEATEGKGKDKEKGEGKGKDKEKKHKKKKEKAAAAGGAAPAAAAGAPGAAATEAPPKRKEKKKEEKPEPDFDDYLDPDKLILFKHWIRPKFLPYKYIYDYRYNYYDDVLDFLNKRQCGEYRDVPVPQTWAERALRTYNNELNKLKLFREAQEDTKLCTKIRLGCRFHLYHSKEYFNRRYSSIM